MRSSARKGTILALSLRAISGQLGQTTVCGFFFTIMDFKRATVLFSDPDFDGEPVQIYEPWAGQTRAVLDALLDKFADGGVKSVESLDILKVDPLTAFGTPVEIVKLFGGKEKYLAAIHELETELYLEAA